MHEILRMSAGEVVGLLRRREIAPLEVLEIVLARIVETDPLLNSLPTRCAERARKDATRLMANWPPDPPPWFLFGLPIAVKDLNDVAGVRTTYGSSIFSDHVPIRSDCAVQLLEMNGAVVVAKSNVPEFGAGCQTYNNVFGVTKNPWDTRKTPGGSSGGSAAAIAAGLVWIATGSDFGGSLRIPASFTSTVALRPSPGRVARGPGRLPFNLMPVEGPMARNVSDLALMLDAEVGHHPEDPISVLAPQHSFTQAVDRPYRPKRVAFSADLGVFPIDPEVRSICARAVQKFTEVGAAVTEDCFDLHDAEETYAILRAAMAVYDKAEIVARHRDQVKPELLSDYDRGVQLSSEEIGRAERVRGATALRAADFFKKYDCLVCPASPIPPFDHSIHYPVEINGRRLNNYFSWMNLSTAITLTSCPVVSVPCGYTESGLPIGLQIVGPAFQEHKLLGIAKLLEDALGLSHLLPIEPRQNVK